MRLLDLFCGAGGAAMGYHRAGFDEIVGVDIVLHGVHRVTVHQPNGGSMTYRVKIEFNQEDFTEKGLDKIRDVICRNQRLDPDRVIMEWPTPILWAKGWMEEYVVEPVEVLGFPVVISEELDIGEDDPPIFGHLEIQVMEEQ